MDGLCDSKSCWLAAAALHTKAKRFEFREVMEEDFRSAPKLVWPTFRCLHRWTGGLTFADGDDRVALPVKERTRQCVSSSSTESSALLIAVSNTRTYLGGHVVSLETFKSSNYEPRRTTFICQSAAARSHHLFATYPTLWHLSILRKSITCSLILLFLFFYAILWFNARCYISELIAVNAREKKKKRFCDRVLWLTYRSTPAGVAVALLTFPAHILHYDNKPFFVNVELWAKMVPALGMILVWVFGRDSGCQGPQFHQLNDVLFHLPSFTWFMGRHKCS